MRPAACQVGQRRVDDDDFARCGRRRGVAHPGGLTGQQAVVLVGGVVGMKKIGLCDSNGAIKNQAGFEGQKGKAITFLHLGTELLRSGWI